MLAEDVCLGGLITTRSGTAAVTQIQRLGRELILWADYGSGIAQPHVRENATCGLKIVLGGQTLSSQTSSEQPLLVEQAAPVSWACGWIGWKETKRQRKNRQPWVCRQAWLYWEEPGQKKRSCYIPKAKLAQVEEMVYQLKRPSAETLELLGKAVQ